jgi:hypothetical protein
VALFVAAALAGTLSGVLFAYSDDLPEVSALDNYTPNTITRVLDKDGQLVGEFAVERRVVVHYDDIPVNLRQAILAAEDVGFFQHAGLSISRMMLALARDIFSRGNVPGGSTLTQQLARNLFPKTIGFDRTWVRAEGAHLWDADGKRVLDLLGGFGMFNVGRNNPRVRAALVEALELDLPGSVQLGASPLPPRTRLAFSSAKPTSTSTEGSVNGK